MKFPTREPLKTESYKEIKVFSNYWVPMALVLIMILDI